MYGTREELCVQLENMFTFDEPLVLLVWTEEGISIQRVAQVRLCWRIQSPNSVCVTSSLAGAK